MFLNKKDVTYYTTLKTPTEAWIAQLAEPKIDES